jgi:hypothetical protein
MQSDLEGPVNPSAKLRAGLGSDERVTVGTTDYTDYTDEGTESVKSVKSVVRGVGQADQGEVRARACGCTRAELQQGAHQVVGLGDQVLPERRDRTDVSVDRGAGREIANLKGGRDG